MKRLKLPMLASVLTMSFVVFSIFPGAVLAQTNDALGRLDPSAVLKGKDTVVQSPAKPASHAEERRYNLLTVDTANKNENVSESEAAQKFEWFRDDFTWNGAPASIFYRLYIPNGPKPTDGYPLVMTLHGSNGMGTDNHRHMGLTANYTTDWVSDIWQSEHPCYVLAVQMPHAGEVCLASEMAYLHEYGEIIKKIAKQFGDVDSNRIYTTGMSQGAGFSYGAAVEQPNLFAAALIASGTTVHSTYGQQLDLSKLKNLNLWVVHGANDPYILLDEAFRAYDGLVRAGNSNVKLTVFTKDGLNHRGMDPQASGHATRLEVYKPEGTEYMKWLFAQRKGIQWSTTPVIDQWEGIVNVGTYPGWDMDIRGHFHLVPSFSSLSRYSSASGETHLANLRIPAPLTFFFDDSKYKQETHLKAGDTIYITLQGYTGKYTTRRDFDDNWIVEYLDAQGSIASIEVLNAAVPGFSRTDEVSQSEGSLASNDVLNGMQVYIKVVLKDALPSDELLMYLKFTNPDGYTYYHKIERKIEKQDTV